MHKGIRIAVLGAAVTAIAAPAFAIDEILVTAQRREESLQSVPLAVSAFNADKVANLQIDVVKDIGQNVPNLQTYTVTAGAQAIQVHARGASVQNPGFNLSESPVGIYYDDVYFGRLASVNAELGDIERIEVLRGPQGTLYGRNTIAGAIKIVTRTPGDESWASVNAGYGNYDTLRLSGSVGGPLEQGSIAGSISGVYERRGEGWQNNPVTGKDPGEYENQAARGKLRIYGIENLDITLTGWTADIENDGYNGVPQYPFANTGPNADFDPAPANSRPLGQFGGLPVASGDFYSNYSSAGVNYGESNQGGGSVDIKWNVAGLTVRSITAFSSIDDKFGFDLAGGGFPVDLDEEDENPVDFFANGLVIASDSHLDQFSQEFQVLGNAFGDSLSYLAGAFYLEETGDQVFNGTLVAPPPAFSEMIDNKTKSYSVFAEATYKFTSELSGTIGGRYTKDRKEFSDTCAGFFCFDDIVGPADTTPATESVALEDNFDETTFKLGLSWQLSDDQLLYGTFAQGFQAGGFRTLCFGNLSASCAGTAFDPQTVDSFEVGYKGDLLGDTLRVNADVFYAMYDDIQQIVINNAGGFPIDNIGEVDVYGVELEVTWAPVENFNVFANLGFQESDFGKVSPDSPPGGLGGNAPPTKELPSNPGWQGKVGFDYTLALGNDLKAMFGLDVFATDDYFSESRNQLEIQGYERLNGFIGVGSNDGDWMVSLTGKNITDEEDEVSGIFANGFTNIRTVLPPVEYMLNVKLNF